MSIWERVRKWAKLRGIDSVDTDTQYQRFLQEAVEIHDALIKNDKHEFRDAIGDTIITLINLAGTKDIEAEDCLEEAFQVIEHRKGITSPKGDFIRYAKLDTMYQNICDEQQGNPGEEYFERDAELTREDFKWK